MDILLEAEARIKAANHHLKSVTVLIVQIGNDPYAAKYFKELSQAVVSSTLLIFSPSEAQRMETSEYG